MLRNHHNGTGRQGSLRFRTAGLALVWLGAIGCSSAALPGAILPLQYPTHPQAVPAVSRLLSDDSVLVGEAQVEVQSLGDGATPEMLKAMSTASSEGKLRLLESATTIGKPPAVVGRMYYLAVRDPDEKVRLGAAFQAVRAPALASQTSPALERLLADTVPEVKAAGLKSLATLNDRKALTSQRLAGFINDSNPLICATAVSIALSREDSLLEPLLRKTLPRLVTQLHNPQPASRAAVITALGAYGEAAAPTVPPLISVARTDNVPEVRLQAAVALMRIGTAPAKAVAHETFVEFAASSNPALKALAKGFLKTNKKPEPPVDTPLS